MRYNISLFRCFHRSRCLPSNSCKLQINVRFYFQCTLIRMQGTRKQNNIFFIQTRGIDGLSGKMKSNMLMQRYFCY